MHGSTLSLFSTIASIKHFGVEPVLLAPSQWKWDKEFEKAVHQLGVRFYKAYIVQSIIEKDAYMSFTLKQRLWFFFCLFRNKFYSYRDLSRIVKAESPDIIHTNVGVVHEGFWVAKRFGIPHIFHLREYQDKDFGWKILPSKRFFQILLRNSTVITITDDIRRYFNLFDSKNSYTIYNGISTQNILPIDLPKDKYFFCASRISEEKGLEDVISSFITFSKAHPDYRLIIAGKGSAEYENKLKLIASKGGLEDSIQFVGQIDNVFDYMRKASALIVGSFYEGFGRMSAEAAFSGCLIIGRYTGGTKEILDIIGEDGFMDNTQMMSLMEKVACMTSLEYKELAQKAQQKAASLFSIEQNVSQLYCVCKSLVLK